MFPIIFSNMARYVMNTIFLMSHYLDSFYTIRQSTIGDVAYINIHLHNANGPCSLLRSLSFWRLSLKKQSIVIRREFAIKYYLLLINYTIQYILLKSNYCSHK